MFLCISTIMITEGLIWTGTELDQGDQGCQYLCTISNNTCKLLHDLTTCAEKIVVLFSKLFISNAKKRVKPFWLIFCTAL